MAGRPLHVEVAIGPDVQGWFERNAPARWPGSSVTRPMRDSYGCAPFRCSASRSGGGATARACWRGRVCRGRAGAPTLCSWRPSRSCLPTLRARRLCSGGGQDDYEQVLAGHHALIRSALAAHGGREADTQGDAFFAVFSSPRACMAAVLEMQQAIEAHGWPGGEQVRVRMGIHCGEAARTATGLVGLEVHRAARVAAVAYGGQVLVSEAAAVLVRDGLPPGAALADLGGHRLKDLGRPERIFQLHAAGLPAEFPPLRSLGNPTLANNLPAQLSTFIGRDREVAEVRALVESSRLVTLTGAGGCGKTRLGLQVAAGAAGRVRGRGVAGGAGRGHRRGRGAGGHLAGAAAGRAAGPAGAGGAAGCPGPAGCADRAGQLRAPDRRLRQDRGGDLAALPAGAPAGYQPGAAGHRRGDHLPGALAVAARPGIRTPAPGSSDAVALFVDRARASGVALAVEEQAGPLAVSVCRRLDGMPLAIELAAARLRSMSLAELADRLDQRFRLLTGGSRTALERQQTLRATVDWSYSLLTGAEQVLLGRLSVFAGGFDLDAAEAVCGSGRLDALEVAGSARLAGGQEPGGGRARRGNPAVPAAGDDPAVRRRAARRGRRRRGRRGGGGALRAFPGGRGAGGRAPDRAGAGKVANPAGR